MQPESTQPHYRTSNLCEAVRRFTLTYNKGKALQIQADKHTDMHHISDEQQTNPLSGNTLLNNVTIHFTNIHWQE